MNCLDGCLSMLVLLFLVGILGILVSNPVFWVLLLCIFVIAIWAHGEGRKSP